MIDKIYLKKDGFFVKNDSGKIVKINKPISYYLQYGIKLEKGFNVEDLMNLLIQYEERIDLLFLSYTRGFHLRPFYEEMKIEYPIKERKSACIETYWCVDIWNSKELTVWPSAHEIWNKTQYSLMCTPIYEIKHLPLKINNSFKLEEFIVYKPSENKKPQLNKIFSGTKDFNLQDFIGGFLYEITWSGYPDQKNKATKELDERVEDVDSKTFISSDQMFLEIYENELEELLSKKKPSQKRIEYLKTEIEHLKNKK